MCNEINFYWVLGDFCFTMNWKCWIQILWPRKVLPKRIVSQPHQSMFNQSGPSLTWPIPLAKTISNLWWPCSTNLPTMSAIKSVSVSKSWPFSHIYHFIGHVSHHSTIIQPYHIWCQTSFKHITVDDKHHLSVSQLMTNIIQPYLSWSQTSFNHISVVSDIIQPYPVGVRHHPTISKLVPNIIQPYINWFKHHSTISQLM